MREEIAEVITLELFFGEYYEIKDPDKFIERFGAFYPLFLALKNSRPWPKLQKIAKKSPEAGIAGLKLLLALTYDILERFSYGGSRSGAAFLKELDSGMEAIFMAFEEALNATLLRKKRCLEAGCGNSSFQNPEASALLEKVLSFMQMEGSQLFLERLLFGIYGRMDEFASEIEENLELFETLALLFPERDWSYSVKELKKESFYVQLKMLKKYADFFEKNSLLRKIVDFIGRREYDPPGGPVHLSPFGKNRIETVSFSNSIENLLPLEAGKLLNPTLKKKFYADLLEGKLLSYRFLGKHFSGPPRLKPKGPLIALVDTSGSMHGAPQTLAKALVLAITKRMLQQKREVKVILFASTSQHLEIELSSKKMMSETFLNFLLYTFGGGTDFNTALASGLKALKEKDFLGADLLFITDGKSEVSDKEVLARWEDAKKRYGAKVYSLIVGGNGAGGLSAISDYTYLVEIEPDAEKGDVCKVVRLVEISSNEER